MKAFVTKGKWRDTDIQNMNFDLISPDIMFGKNGHYVTVDGKPLNSNTKNIRIYLNSPSDCIIEGKLTELSPTKSPSHNVPLDGDTEFETEKEAIDRINSRFEILHEMTVAASRGDIRGMIVSGAPGVGKSKTIDDALSEQGVSDFIANNKFPFEVIRGNVSPIGLYKKLFEFRHERNVIVFDDSDSVFFDPISLGLLKTALDTSSKRVLSWNSESRILKDEGIDSRFEFQGSVIFITNMNLENTKSKQLKPHFDALISRSHYLDLTIKTRRDKFLRIKGLVNDGAMLKKYEFKNNQDQEILSYMKDNIETLRELSLRTTIKIADIVKIKPNNWKELCDITVCRTRE